MTDDQLHLDQQRPTPIDGAGEGGEVQRELRAVSSTPTPAVAPSLARQAAEADRDAGLALRAIAQRLPLESSRRTEMLEDAEDYLTRARFAGLPVPAVAPVRRRAG